MLETRKLVCSQVSNSTVYTVDPPLPPPCIYGIEIPVLHGTDEDLTGRNMFVL